MKKSHLAILAAAVIAAIWFLWTRRRRTSEELQTLVSKWLGARPSKQEWFNYLPVDGRHAARLKKSTGKNFAGYTHRIDSDSARHALNRHGKDELPVTPEDLASLAFYILHAQTVEAVEKMTGPKLPGLRYTYTQPGGTIVIIEEVREGRKRLAFVTMHKKSR